MANNGKGRAGVIFTAVMIACCIGLYLLGTGNGKAEVTAEAAATPVPAREKQRAYPAEDVFFERVKEYGMEDNIVSGDNVGAAARKYSVTREDLPEAELVLSLRNGGICAFTLTVPRAEQPEPLSKKPSAVEISLYEQRLASYQLESEWMNKNFAALVSGIDVMGEVTYGDITSMMSLIVKTVEDGKGRSMDAGDFEHTVSLIEDKLYVTVSAKDR